MCCAGGQAVQMMKIAFVSADQTATGVQEVRALVRLLRYKGT